MRVGESEIGERSVVYEIDYRAVPDKGGYVDFFGGGICNVPGFRLALYIEDAGIGQAVLNGGRRLDSGLIRVRPYRDVAFFQGGPVGFSDSFPPARPGREDVAVDGDFTALLPLDYEHGKIGFKKLM